LVQEGVGVHGWVEGWVGDWVAMGDSGESIARRMVRRPCNHSDSRASK
jgi:hypothetical protein